MELYNNLNNKIMLKELEILCNQIYVCRDKVVQHHYKIDELDLEIKKLQRKKIDLKYAIKDKVGMDLDNLQK